MSLARARPGSRADLGQRMLGSPWAVSPCGLGLFTRYSEVALISRPYAPYHIEVDSTRGLRGAFRGG